VAAQRSKRRGIWLAIAAMSLTLFSGLDASHAEEFEEALERIDKALRENPGRVTRSALESCGERRKFASELYRSGFTTRAERRLKFCFDLLRISETPPAEKEQLSVADSMKQLQKQAALEIESALTLTPNIERGLEVYRGCARCHKAEGWGLSGGSVPQVAGQHRKVVIKQLADIRAGNRDNAMMLPYACVETIGPTQAVSDVAGYIGTLEMNLDNGKGPGKDLELGGRLYAEKCAGCHGAQGEGNEEAFVPRIQAQHYKYLRRQLEWVREGKRRNANPGSLAQMQEFPEREANALLDYVSRLEPPAELQAPPGWKNPDFRRPAP
jgi:cytochrome c553